MITKTGSEKEDEEEEVALPGFRFHPTDEELLGFYLRRKVDKKPLASIDALIKQVDIYKYDPWDLPKSNGAGEKEGYFFCKRGRKYRNSIRPNRVTGSGFWKATGIDKPVYSHAGEGRDSVVGLKKTLVYYRGSAGKGTKTDWMMHEFRLPTNDAATTTADAKSSTTQEAEVWTLCRIFKRNVSYRKYAPDWREVANKRTQPTPTAQLLDQAIISNNNNSINYRTSISAVDCNSYVSFGASPLFMSNNNNVNGAININKKLGSVTNQYYETQDRKLVVHSDTAAVHHHHDDHQPPSSSNSIGNDQQLLSYGDWDELRSVVDFAFDSPL